MNEISLKNDENLSKQNVGNNLLKWLSIIPAAIGGYFMGVIVVKLFTFIQFFWLGISYESGWGKFNNFIGTHLIGSILGIYLGAKAAPKHKHIVALILFTILVILNTMVIIGLIITKPPDVIWSILSAIASIIGSIFLVKEFFEKKDDFKLFE